MGLANIWNFPNLIRRWTHYLSLSHSMWKLFMHHLQTNAFHLFPSLLFRLVAATTTLYLHTQSQLRWMWDVAATSALLPSSVIIFNWNCNTATMLTSNLCCNSFVFAPTTIQSSVCHTHVYQPAKVNEGLKWLLQQQSYWSPQSSISLNELLNVAHAISSAFLSSLRCIGLV